mmetsp:Transcript_11191/g.24991  ORF Transcript_11191/g.24991 Transcript_11191/m.24991 type:complete len:413 (+) Transcript_11191:244-1482(+)
MTTQTQDETDAEKNSSSSPSPTVATKYVGAESPDIPLLNEPEEKLSDDKSEVSPLSNRKRNNEKPRVTRQAVLANPQAFVPYRIAKVFDGTIYTGSVESYTPAATHDGSGVFHITYDDGDREVFFPDDLVHHISLHQSFVQDITEEELLTNPEKFRARRVAKTLPDLTVRFGTVTSFRRGSSPLWRVWFDDGQRDEINTKDVADYLQNYEEQLPVFSPLNEGTIRAYPTAFLDRRVAKSIKGKLVVGTVCEFHLTRGAKPSWTVQYDIGSHGDEEFTVNDMVIYMKEYDYAQGKEDKMAPLTLAPRTSPLKRKHNEMETTTAMTTEALEKEPERFIKARIAQYFGDELHFGSVTSFLPADQAYSEDLWHVLYDDKDEADYNAEELLALLELCRKNKCHDARGMVMSGEGWYV